MADYDIHFAQAEHNEKLSRKLINEPPFHDWSITAAFYAAIHYIECWIFNRKEKHSETSIPVYKKGRQKGKFMYSPHGWREKLVEMHSSKSTFKSLRKLREASETARYLSLTKLGYGNWIPSPASDYFSPSDALKLIKNDLSVLKKELHIK